MSKSALADWFGHNETDEIDEIDETEEDQLAHPDDQTTMLEPVDNDHELDPHEWLAQDDIDSEQAQEAPMTATTEETRVLPTDGALSAEQDARMKMVLGTAQQLKDIGIAPEEISGWLEYVITGDFPYNDRDTDGRGGGSWA